MAPTSDRKWIRPDSPKFVKVAKVQRVRNQKEGGKLFAVRYIYEIPASTEIRAGGSIIPAPEFGAILYNVELYQGVIVFSGKMRDPVEKDGVRANYWAEVWKTQNDEPKLLAEDWFASEVPEQKTFAEFVKELLKFEQMQNLHEFQRLAPRPVVSFKRLCKGAEESRIDHWTNAREVCERLLRREYPMTFRALDRKAGDEAVRMAFIADNIANSGVAPEAEGSDRLLRERQFIDYLSSALKSRGHKVSAAEWALATGWVKWGIHQMSENELERSLKDKTGLAIKGGSWRRKADRLGLIRSGKPGRPENPNLLPPDV